MGIPPTQEGGGGGGGGGDGKKKVMRRKVMESSEHRCSGMPTVTGRGWEGWGGVPEERALCSTIDAQNGKSSTVSPSGTVSDGNLNSDTVSENNRNSAKHRLEQCSVYCQTPFRATMGPFGPRNAGERDTSVRRS